MMILLSQAVSDRDNDFKKRECPFKKITRWKKLEVILKKFCDPKLWNKTNGRFEGRTLRRLEIMDICDNEKPTEADISLRNIGTSYRQAYFLKATADQFVSHLSLEFCFYFLIDLLLCYQLYHKRL